MDKKIYVSIKGPDGVLLMNKVEINPPNENIRKASKELRALAAKNLPGFARNIRMRSARLAWAVFAGANDEKKPVMVSDNWNPEGGKA